MMVLDRFAQQSHTGVEVIVLYELVCGVPGHAISEQWDALVVSATADAASVTPSGAATITVK